MKAVALVLFNTEKNKKRDERCGHQSFKLSHRKPPLTMNYQKISPYWDTLPSYPIFLFSSTLSSTDQRDTNEVPTRPGLVGYINSLLHRPTRYQRGRVSLVTGLTQELLIMTTYGC